MLMLRTIGAQFAGTPGTVYTYFVPEEDNPEVGDLILTSVSFEPGYPMGPMGEAAILASAKLATVVDVHAPGTPAPKARRFYVSLVKAADVKAAADRNAVLFQRIEADKAARKELDAMLAAEDQRVRYLRLAETNPRARELMQQLGDLIPPAAEPEPQEPEMPSGQVEVMPPKRAPKRVLRDLWDA